MTDPIQTVREALTQARDSSRTLTYRTVELEALDRIEAEREQLRAVVKAAREEHFVPASGGTGYCACGRDAQVCHTLQALSTLDSTEAPEGFALEVVGDESQRPPGGTTP